LSYVWSGGPSGLEKMCRGFLAARVEDDKIREMAGYPTRESATKAAKRFAAQRR
jgi:hypothetical protein